MLHRLLADGVMATHFGYLVYLVVGGFLAWRWPRAIYPHLVAVAWALGIVLIGFPCPLTGIERRLRQPEGTVVEVLPVQHTPILRDQPGQLRRRVPEGDPPHRFRFGREAGTGDGARDLPLAGQVEQYFAGTGVRERVAAVVRALRLVPDSEFVCHTTPQPTRAQPAEAADSDSKRASDADRCATAAAAAAAAAHLYDAAALTAAQQ